MRPIHWLIVVALSLPLVAGAEEAAAPRTDDGGTKTDGDLDKGSGLSGSEKVEKARDHVDAMRSVLSDVLKKLEEARESKDVIKLNCVNAALTNVKGLLKVAEGASVLLEEAVAKREDDAAEHEFTKITISRQKTDQLRNEAEACVGDVGGDALGETDVEVEEPEGLPPGTNVAQDKPFVPSVVRPPAASPTG